MSKVSPEIRAFFAKSGRKGGKARAKALTSTQRQDIARKGAKSRWDAVRLEREKGLAS